MNHKFENDQCTECGLTAIEYLNGSEWAALFCPGKQLILPNITCCNFRSIVLLGGKWICESCGYPDKDLNRNKMENYSITKCTCGALKVHGENTPGHYNDCDLKKRK